MFKVNVEWNWIISEIYLWLNTVDQHQQGLFAANLQHTSHAVQISLLLFWIFRYFLFSLDYEIRKLKKDNLIAKEAQAF